MIENIRALHAEIDRDISNIVIELQHKEKRQKRIVYQNQRINDNLLSVQTKSSQLLQLYRDPHHTIRDEIKELTGANLQMTMKRFDTQYMELLRHHQGNSGRGKSGQNFIPEREEQKSMKEPFAYRMNKQSPISFSVEEHYGRYLDLHHFFQSYLNLFPTCNLPVPKEVDYFTYLKIFPLFHRIDKRIRRREEYGAYLKDLYDYLVNFHKRTQPLANISHVMKSTESYFQEKWSKGELPGWERTKKTENIVKPPPPPTLPQAPPPPPPPAVPQQDEGQPKKKKKKKRKRRRKRKRKKRVEEDIEKYRNVAYLELKISRFLNLLSDHLESTRDQISKKSVRTYSEFQLELEREEEKENEIPEEFLLRNKEGSEEDQYAAMCANPLNLPMGWDGKPIPYWLYKLYNLGQEYKCEICGNYSYWGRRAFDRHFKEWRHSHGMKCLGIPNTKHFHHITRIAAATKLWEKLQRRQKNKSWEEDMEEFEDNQGNVYSRKTYEELKRQGILGE